MQIHIDRGGQRFGPYSVEQVNSQLAEGTILPTDLGWMDGMANWVPVTQVTGVTFAGTTAAAAVPPPTPTTVVVDPYATVTDADQLFNEIMAAGNTPRPEKDPSQPAPDDDSQFDKIMEAGNKPKPKKVSKTPAPAMGGKGQGGVQQPGYMQKALAGKTPGAIPERNKVGYRRPVLPTKPKTNPKKLIMAVAALLVVAVVAFFVFKSPSEKDAPKPGEGGGKLAGKGGGDTAEADKAKAEADKANAAAAAKAAAAAALAAANNKEPPKAPAELAGQLEKLFGTEDTKVVLWLDGPTAPPQGGANAGLVTTKIPKQFLPILAKLAGDDGKNNFLESIDLNKCEYYIGGSTLDPIWVKMDPSGAGGLNGRRQLNFSAGAVLVPKEKAIVVSLKKNRGTEQLNLHISYPPVASGSQILALHMVDKDGTEERLYILKANKQNENYVFFNGLPGWGRKNGNEIVELYPEWVELFGQNGRVKASRPGSKFAANMPTQPMDGKWYRLEVSLAGLELQERTALANLKSRLLLPPGNAAGDQGGMARFTKMGNPPVLTFTFPKPPGAEKLVLVQGTRLFGFTTYYEDAAVKGALVPAVGENNQPLSQTRPLAADTKKITIKLQQSGNNQDPNFRYFWKFDAAKEKEKADKLEAKRKKVKETIVDAFEVEKTKLRNKFKDHENYFGLFVESPTSKFSIPIIIFSPPK